MATWINFSFSVVKFLDYLSHKQAVFPVVLIGYKHYNEEQGFSFMSLFRC